MRRFQAFFVALLLSAASLLPAAPTWAGSKSVALQRALLDHIFSGTSYTPPTQVCIGLLTDTNTDAQRAAGTFTEVSGNGYARACQTANTTNFPLATGSSPASKANATAYTFATPTGNWPTVNGFCAFASPTLSTGTNLLYCGSLTVPKTINTGDAVTFPASSLTFTEL